MQAPEGALSRLFDPGMYILSSELIQSRAVSLTIDKLSTWS